jgi:hypothetical protein
MRPLITLLRRLLNRLPPDIELGPGSTHTPGTYTYNHKYKEIFRLEPAPQTMMVRVEEGNNILIWKNE